MNKRTNYNGKITSKNLNEKVNLFGWVAKKRDLGGLIFVDLRDYTGIVQLIIRPDSKYYELAASLKNEYVIEINGIVSKREAINSNMPTGEIEVLVEKLILINIAANPPIDIKDDLSANEDTRLTYRYLDLRRPIMQNYLLTKSKITQILREVLLKSDFNELETPILGKSTPEGARDFLVPSRLYNGHFYALPQSPQIYKQLYMVAGFDKYFQFARCFRDEDLRADRQLEFTQLDIEMSFIKPQNIYKLVEKMLKKLFKEIKNVDIKIPFSKLTYKNAMEFYGSDKPDLRIDYKIIELSNLIRKLNIEFLSGHKIVKGLIFDNDVLFTRKKLEEYTQLIKNNHGKNLLTLKIENNILSGSIAKFTTLEFATNELNLREGQTLYMVAGEYDDVVNSLGVLRCQIANDLGLLKEEDFAFTWIVDFPLLEFSQEDNRYYAKHHPFTSCKDINILKSNPKKSLANAYDIVLNGYELGGGSIRIFDQFEQALMFETLGFTQEETSNQFGFLLNSLKYGTPPHGGIALGLDRITMLLTGTSNIKDVIAFPKTQNARDLMMEAPSLVSNKQLDELELLIKNPTNE